jgi:hypothetical protein
VSEPIVPTVRAELIGSDTATALGIAVRSSSPVLALCRKLLEVGFDHTTPLEAWRGDTLCLRVSSIGEAAVLEVAPHGVGFTRPPQRRRVSPMRHFEEAAE